MSKLKTNRPQPVRLGSLRVLGRDDDLNYNVSLEVMRSGLNQNNWFYENVDRYAYTFCGTPILCAFPDGRIGDGHNHSEIRMPNGEVLFDFTGPNHEKIVGAISERPEDIRVEERDGEMWVIAKGKLWRFYNQKLVDQIARLGSMEVSAETDVMREYEKDGIAHFPEWRGLGVTILGQGVAPAIPGANIKALKELGERFNQIKLAAASYCPRNNEPQSKKKEGVKKTLNALNKNQIAALSKRFEGYTVLAAAENENGNVFVCLMAADGTCAIYRMESISDSTIVPEKIRQINVNASFGFGGDDVIEVAVCDMTESLSATATRLNADLAAANSALTEARSTITAMQNAENARRLKAAKDKAESTLSAFNANRAKKVDASVLDSIRTDIEAGRYTGCADANGQWTGEEEVENAVLAVCAKRVMQLDADDAARARKVLAWNELGGDPNADDGSIEGLIASWGIN